MLTTDPTSSEFLNHLRDMSWEFGTEVFTGDLFPDSAELIEWGILNDLAGGQLVANQDKIDASRYLNSKLTQRDWKAEHHLSPILTRLISSEEALIDYLNETHSPIVLKGRYGIAGRNHIILEHPSQGWKLQQIAKKLYNYPIFAEAWYGKDRVLDFSTLWEFNETGPLYLGSTEMIMEEDGSFRGIRMSALSEKNLIPILSECLEVVKTVFLQSEIKPIGPAAMDGFFYNNEGLVKAQVFSEINFRYSMGRILYEIRKKRNSRVQESGIVFLPLTKIKSFDEWVWLAYLRNKSEAEFFFVTPPRDSKSKLFQNVGLYYEEKGNKKEDLLTFIGEEWRKLMEF